MSIDQALNSRKQLLDEASRRSRVVLAYHTDAIGAIERTTDSYRLIPDRWVSP